MFLVDSASTSVGVALRRASPLDLLTGSPSACLGEESPSTRKDGSFLSGRLKVHGAAQPCFPSPIPLSHALAYRLLRVPIQVRY